MIVLTQAVAALPSTEGPITIGTVAARLFVGFAAAVAAMTATAREQP